MAGGWVCTANTKPAGSNANAVMNALIAMEIPFRIVVPLTVYSVAHKCARPVGARIGPFICKHKCDIIPYMYETFDHTADLGLRITAPDLNTLFEEAAQALFSIIVDGLDTVQPLQCVEIVLPADELEYLLFDWLKRLLFHFDAEHLLLSRFTVNLDNLGLKGQAWGEPIDRSRHLLEHEVKAVTYHGLKVEKTESGWLAEVIVDI